MQPVLMVLQPVHRHSDQLVLQALILLAIRSQLLVLQDLMLLADLRRLLVLQALILLVARPDLMAPHCQDLPVPQDLIPKAGQLLMPATPHSDPRSGLELNQRSDQWSGLEVIRLQLV